MAALEETQLGSIRNLLRSYWKEKPQTIKAKEPQEISLGANTMHGRVLHRSPRIKCSCNKILGWFWPAASFCKQPPFLGAENPKLATPSLSHSRESHNSVAEQVLLGHQNWSCGEKHEGRVGFPFGGSGPGAVPGFGRQSLPP